MFKLGRVCTKNEEFAITFGMLFILTVAMGILCLYCHVLQLIDILFLVGVLVLLALVVYLWGFVFKEKRNCILCKKNTIKYDTKYCPYCGVQQPFIMHIVPIYKWSTKECEEIGRKNLGMKK